ncbi:hypothetical protein LCGC14_0580810 [marine sediment metagenome]|uniref:Uncharacterized protein n=1 Tax=marine sediment metagenome TaxID=412755 RepID=A0A0F9RLI3_9ZZZZ
MLACNTSLRAKLKARGLPVLDERKTGDNLTSPGNVVYGTNTERSMTMKVGTICKLKVNCLNNKAGTLGVVFNDYGDGFQAIFENGSYDGFSTTRDLPSQTRSVAQIEADYFLEEVGFEESLAAYQFKNVNQVFVDYIHRVFDIAWSEGWKKTAILSEHKFGTEQLAGYLDKNYPPEYEKCEVYGDGHAPPFLVFDREHSDGGRTVCTLSRAMDYVDFSHFEYARPDLGKSIMPRWIQADITIYPRYVVFRKNL